jgi:hypothetical protein
MKDIAPAVSIEDGVQYRPMPRKSHVKPPSECAAGSTAVSRLMFSVLFLPGSALLAKPLLRSTGGVDQSAVGLSDALEPRSAVDASARI